MARAIVGKASPAGLRLGVTFGLLTALWASGCGPAADKIDATRSLISVDRTEGIRADGLDQLRVVVNALNVDGKPVPGKSVELTATGADNVLKQPVEVTDADGTAMGFVTSTTAEEKTIGAVVDGVELTTTVKVTFVLPRASKLAFQTQPQNAIAGDTLSTLTVALLDELNRVVTSETTPVQLALVGGAPGTVLAGTLQAVPVNGVATFSDLSIAAAGDYALTASATGLTEATSSSFTIATGAAAKLEIAELPASIVAGESASFAVTVRDAKDNVVPGYSGTVTFGSDDPGATLPAAYTFVAADHGLHHFTGLVLKKAGTRTLTAADGNGLSREVTVPVVAAAADHFALTGLSASLVSGTPASVTATVADAFDNTVLDYAGTAALSTADGALASYTFLASEHGVHIFSDIVFRAASSSQFLRIEDSASSTVFGLLANLTVAPGAPAALAFTAQPAASAEVRTSLGEIKVGFLDANNNAVLDASSDVTLSLSTSANSGALSGTLTATPAAGVATFGGLSIDNEGSGFQLVAKAAGLADATSQAFNVVDTTAPAAVTLSVAGSPSNSAVSLTWTAPGDDGLLGALASYELRYSTSALTDADFSTGTLFPLGAGPKPPGSVETVSVTGLSANTTYYFALRANDGAGNYTFAAVSAATSNCQAGYSGAACDQCATGYQSDGNNHCVDMCALTNPCAAPPAASCEGNTRVTYATAPGICAPSANAPYYTCDFGRTTTDCTATPDQICSGGACVEGAVPGAGDLLFTEVMTSPTGGAEAARWLEFRNISAKQLNLAGLVVEEASDSAAIKTFAFPAATRLLPADTYFVLGGSTDTTANGGATVNQAYDAAVPAFSLAGTGGVLDLTIKSGATVVEHLKTGAGFPSGSGAAMNLSSNFQVKGANANSWYWCAATAAMSGNDLGTPGQANSDCGKALASAVTYCKLQWPLAIPDTANGVPSAVVGVPMSVYERFYAAGATDQNTAGNDNYPFVVGEIGVGTAPDAANWTWTKADFTPGYSTSACTGMGCQNNDEMVGAAIFPAAGAYSYGWRFHLVDATGAAGPYVYCDQTNSIVASSAGSWATATVQGASATSADIAAVRAAVDGTVSLPVRGAIVTYVKPGIGDLAVDGPGFFLQAEQLGPAIYVGIDPATLAPAPKVGDFVAFTATTVGTQSGLKLIKALSGWRVLQSGKDVAALVQDETGIDVNANIGTLESELIAMDGTIAAAPSASGQGFVAAQFNTGTVAVGGVKLRVPQSLQDTVFDLAANCTARLKGTPLWRYTTTTQPSAWVASDLTVTSCPAPAVASASATAGNKVVVAFDRLIAPASVAADGSQFTFDNGLTASAATVSGRTVTVTTSAQTGGTIYTVTVAATVTDTYGSALQAVPKNAATFLGYVVPAVLMLNEINPNITSSLDLIELLVVSAGNTSGIVIQEGASTILVTLPFLDVAKDDIIVVHLKPTTGTTTTETNASGKGGCTHTACYATAWDINGGTSGLTNSHRVVAVKAPDGTYQDAVAFELSTLTGTPPSAFPADVQTIQGLGQWLPSDCRGTGTAPVPCTYNSSPSILSISADYAGAATSAIGNSVRRMGATDTNTSADWLVGASSWGLPNF